MTKLSLAGLLGSLAMFRHLSVAELLELQKEIFKFELGKGLFLLRKGDLADAMYVVVYGLLKLSISSQQGSDKVLELIRGGQSFGDAMLFLDESYPFSAEALEDSLLIKIPKHVLLRLLEKSPESALYLMTEMSRRLHGFMRNVERYSVQNSTQRVIDYLLQTSALQSSDVVRLELKKHMLASYLNLSPETLSRVLHQLSDEELIKVHGATIHIVSSQRLELYQRQITSMQ